MKKTLPLTLLFALITTLAFSQTDRFWSANYDSRSSMVTDKAVARLTFPKEFKLFNLNIEPLRQQLFSIVDAGSTKSAVISLPNVDGQLEQFEVYEASNFAPALQARFPEIRAFSGKGITDKSAYLKISISPQGIQTMIFRTERENEFIEPYTQDHTVYAVFKSTREKGRLPWACSTQEQQYASELKAQIPSAGFTGSSTGELKTMRLAQSCNGEYANWFGATSSAQVALVLAGFNATLTRTNGCYEKDLALHLNLVPETVNVIYYNPATDPYTTLANWNTQLQIALNTTLTGPGTPINVNNAAYDIGHMFGASGGGGNAGCIGCVCVDGVASGTGSTKGRGITSPADGIPQGDNFDIDYVAHEVGHQLGGNHTFSHNNEGTGVNKEVGAGITIMGYAGITSYDPAPHSIDIFHETSIEQIQNNLSTKTCPITYSLAATNATPVVAALTSYTIPISTPFVLTGSATDANAGDVLTYCREQNDNGTGQTGANSVAYATKPTGPNWLTFPASTSPTRYFPRLSTVQAGLLITPPLPGGDAICNIEALSSVSRTLNFRLTARDNHPYVSTPGSESVGQTSFADMTVTVTSTAGPFKVTQPNTNVSWNGGSTQTITWDVNNTNVAPVSTANVKISLSTDGGLTFPTVILASTANDGSEAVTIPSIATTTARIKVEAVGNIYYDMSDVNFSITASNPTFTFVPNAGTAVACGSATAAITLGTTSVLGFVTPINLVATNVPAGTNITYSVNPVVPGNSTVVTLNNVNILTPGTYNITITGTAGAEVKTIVLAYTVNAGSGPSVTAQPSAQTLCAGGNTSFSITSAAATSFQWQESTNGGGSWANVNNGGVYGGATTATLALTGVTAVMNTYQYRCIASVTCGSTTSNAATLTVNAPPSITSQPAASVVCGSTTASFTVTAAGAGLSYQWQVSTTGCAGVWNNIANAAPYSGATTATLSINPTTTAMSGYAYRCVISGTCAPSATTNCVTLTVNTPVAITSQPSASTICAGLQTSFTVAASGTTPTYQWQESTNGGANWNNINNGGVYSGATTATLTLTGVTAGMSSYQYRCIVNGAASCSSVNSTGAVLTVNTAPSIITQPVAATTLCANDNVTFNVAANGTAPTYQWQISTTGAGGPWTNITNGGVYAGATTASLTVTGVTVLMSGSLYRCVVSGTCTPAATSNNAAITVNTPISITTQPVATVNVCATGSTNFTVAATGTTPTYQWQISTTGSGGPWTNINNGGVYTGATTNTLTLTGITAAMNGNRYRCVVTGAAPCGAVNTDNNNGLLNVTPQPVITAAPYTSLMAGWTTTLTVNVTPGPGLTFAWFLNGNQQPETGNTLIADVNRLGNYRVVITGPAGSCQSELLNIKDSASSKLFVYPNPNMGAFTVTEYNPTGAQRQQTISIYDSRGARVYEVTYTSSLPYYLQKVDLRRHGAGVYFVVFRDASGKRLKTAEVVVR